jgi:hypothetical protein
MSRFRLVFGSTALVLSLMGLALPKPAQSGTCFRCAPDFEGGVVCKSSPHGMTACSGDGVNCTLSGSTC